MMLWGLTLLPGNVFTETVEYDINLSMAALETRAGYVCNSQGQAQVIVETERGQFVVCTLVYGNVLQQTLDMKIKAGEKVTLYSEGRGIIHLTGHILNGTPANFSDGTITVRETKHISSKDFEEMGKSTPSDLKGAEDDCWQAVCDAATEVTIKEEPPDSDEEGQQGEDALLTPLTFEGADDEEPSMMITSMLEEPTSAKPPEQRSTRTVITPSEESRCNSGDKQRPRRSRTPKQKSPRGNECRNGKRAKTFLCEECGESFQSNAQLKNHLLYSHSKDKPHNCPTCGKGFKYAGGLQAHLRTHTGEKPYECHSCHKSFADLGTCHRHEKIHSGKNPFQCEFCGKGFAENAPLVRHIRIHTGEKPFQCSTCPKRFSDKGQLKRHERSHLKGAERAVYNGQCDVCGKVLQDSSSLRRHRLLHTDSKPYTCKLCGKGFKDQSTLRQHGRMHDRLDKPEEEFCCIYCPEKFETIQEWTSHNATCGSICPNEMVKLEIENLALIPLIKEEDE